MKGFTYQRPGIVITLSFSTLLSIICIPALLPSWDVYFNGLNAQYKNEIGTAHGARKHAPGLEFFYRTRQYGNPGVNVDQMRFEASEAMARREANYLNKSTFTGEWTSMGPKNLAGRMKAIAFDPNNNLIVYAGAASGGVFKSVDGGVNWAPVMDNAPSIPVGAIAIDHNNTNVIFAGTGEPVMDISRVRSAPSYYGVGVMKSTDAGASWNKLSWPTQSSAIFRIALHPVSSDTFLVATRNNLMKTTNGGQSWVSSALAGVCTDVKYKIGNPATVFAAIGNDNGGTLNGVWRSTAGGSRYTWQRMGSNFPAADSTGRIILCTTPADPNLLMAFVSMNYGMVGSSGQDFLALMKSTDDGETWQRINASGLPKNYTNGQAFYDFCAAISPVDKNLIFTGGLEMYRSSNGGVSWSKVTNGNEPVHVDQHVIEFQPVTNNVYIGNDGGIFKSVSNGSTWDNLGFTLQTIQFYTVSVDGTDPYRIIGGTQDNGTQKLMLKDVWNWSIINGGDGGFCIIDPKNPNLMFSHITVYNYPFRTTTGGNQWENLNRGFQADDRSNWLPPFAYVSATSAKLYTATQYVYKATNVSNVMAVPSFTVISPDLTKRMSYESVISTLAVAPSNANVMYVGTGDGKIQKTENLNDVEVTWTDVTKASMPNRWITRVLVDPVNASTAYVCYSGTGTGHVFKTVDGGSNWTDISTKASGFPDIPVNSMVIPKDNPGVLFVATDLGVLVSTNSGANWSRFGNGLPNVVVYDLAINAANKLIAATHGRGMWMTDAVMGVGPTETPLAGDFALEQNYPNPVIAALHGNTAINYSIRKPMHVTLSVYDMSGRVMQTITRDHSQPGRYSAMISPAELPAGVYFYSLSDGVSSATRKMVVVR